MFYKFMRPTYRLSNLLPYGLSHAFAPLVKIVRQYVIQLLHAFYVMLRSSRHDTEFHAPSLRLQQVRLFDKVFEDRGGYMPGGIGVLFKRFEYLSGGDGLIVRTPGVIICRSCYQSIPIDAGISIS